MRRSLTVLMAFLLATTATGAAYAHDPDEIKSGEDVNDFLLHSDQHGPLTGHLPPTQKDVELVSKLELTDLESGIADVGYFNDHAYLNAWAPNCPNGGGVHVVDVGNPAEPRKVGFLAANPNEYPGEGIHVMHVDTPYFTGDLLLHNNEACSSATPSTLGMSIWNVTDPANPVKLNQFGDAVPTPALFSTGTYHSIHSVQGFTQPGKAFAVMIDNEEGFGPPFKDVDIVDITNPAAPVIVAEVGLEDWPAAQAPLANGDTVFFHDVQFKRIRGHDFLAVSYWDAGQVLLNVDNPANPAFVGDSDYLSPDPETGFTISEGNSHESYWSSNSKFLLSTDEDFSPNRTLFEITTGANAGAYGAGEFGWTPPIANEPGGMINGPVVFGGRGCINAGPNAGPDTVPGEPSPPPASAIPAGPGEEKTVVFSRGTCFFSTKVAAGQDLGYDAVIIGQSHGATRNGILTDGFTCGAQGHNYDEQIPAICTGHRAMHVLFNDPPQYTGPEGTDIPVGTIGEKYQARGVFDGWGYLNLHDATKPNLPIIGTYAVAESLDPAFASGFGILSIHEIKTDPREENLGYISYYNAGFRVVRFNTKGISEVGRFIDVGGNDFWGVFPIGDETVGHGYSGPTTGESPFVLASDRDFGLYIFRYTG
ncbi:hypothetical protein EV643_12434 [Kribbella sp. VKM Ac-2527]|uniref:LVIVD repeat-containing protein n=2 Tax=Kribbella caucasensis TaxID=2512215 RepID=A0A4V3C6V0_9ACTN|nr:hypothetical protein EV643_12434 [Kribbella sp. VKM Ac-2527]